MINDKNQSINLKKGGDLVDLATYRLDERTADHKPDPLIVHIAYAQDNQVYRDGRIVTITDPAEYKKYLEADRNDPKSLFNELVNKFGKAYDERKPMLLHRKLADTLIDTAIDMRDRHRQFTVVMDGLRSYEEGVAMQENRPEFLASGLLAKAGTSAHNRALAVDSKLFQLVDSSILDANGRIKAEAAAADPALKQGKIAIARLVEADEKGHLDDIDMTINSRFYKGEMSEAARTNRLNRLQAWQRASVKNNLPVANLLSEFWDDRVCGSPADMWRVLTARSLAIGVDGNPDTNPIIAELRDKLDALHVQQSQGAITRDAFAVEAHALFADAWERNFAEHKQQLESVLGAGASTPPALESFAPVFHEWLETIHTPALEKEGWLKTNEPEQPPASKVYVAPRNIGSIGLS